MRKAKVTEQQIEKLRNEIKSLVEHKVWGGWKEFLKIWEREAKCGNPYDAFTYLGEMGYNGYIFWKQVVWSDIFHNCGFDKTMTFREFLTQINDIWINVATRMILRDLADDSEELAY